MASMKNALFSVFAGFGLLQAPGRVGTPPDARAARPASDTVIAIDVLLEPDAAMVAKATALNARLRGNYPGGYSLDATHAPHVTFATVLEPVALDGVPERLGRAVNNLLDNAAKYAPEESAVDVKLEGTTLTVRDRGPGVPPEELPHIFDRFYRAANARERAGSGLGLAIVKQVAERHGGTVRAEPAPGGGLAVLLELPSARPVTAVPEPAGR